MAKIPGCRQVSGTYGKVWWDGDLLYEVNSFESKLTVEREDVKFAGDMTSDSKMMGLKGEGSMKIKKVYSRAQRKIAQAVKSGKDPRSQLIASVSDPDAFGTERVILKNVWFNEVTLLKFEVGSKLEEELPFGFTGYDFPDLIPAKY